MLLPIPAGNFAAYLFDCDGTIADSMPLHFLAWNTALEEWGGHFDRDLFYAWAGIPIPRTVGMLNERFHWNLPVEAVVARREKAYLELLPGLKPVASVLEHIRLQYGKIPLAVVSGSPRASVRKTLMFLGLEHCFDVIVGGDDCSRGKPHPDPFLLAASRLGVVPAKCLVFEDSDLGIQAAQAAGMAWVKVPAQKIVS